jgi:hypothetical protein
MRAACMWRLDCRWHEENLSMRGTRWDCFPRFNVGATLFSPLGLAMFAGVWQAGGMKKQAADQSFHDRRYQERKRAEAERKVPKKKMDKQGSGSRAA